MPGQKIGYIRVSSVDQNLDRQLDGVELEETFTDRCSGSTRDRPQLQACMRHLRKGDELHVHSMDQLARDAKDLQTMVEELIGRAVTVVFHKEALTFSGQDNLFQKLQLQILAAFSEFDRAMIRERQREGIAMARKNGKQIGAPRKLTAEQIKEIRRIKRENTHYPIAQLARDYAVSRKTIYNAL